MDLMSLIKISRPRFWTYTAGPFLIGSLIANKNLLFGFDFRFYILLLILLIPANLFIYGVNDYFDSRSDSANPKKEKKEFKYTKKRQKIYIQAIFFGIIGIIVGLLMSISFFTKIILILFYFLAFFYSAPPLRFKSLPFFDFISNSFYALPAVIGYYEFSGKFINFYLLAAMLFWTGAMHIFSAISDIEFDKKEEIKTTAVLLGKDKSLLLCFVLWSLFFIIVVGFDFIFLISVIYPFIPIYLFFNSQISIDKIYWSFPYINTLLGFALFIYAITKPFN